jgi:hypothetical protein
MKALRDIVPRVLIENVTKKDYHVHVLYSKGGWGERKFHHAVHKTQRDVHAGHENRPVDQSAVHRMRKEHPDHKKLKGEGWNVEDTFGSHEPDHKKIEGMRADREARDAKMGKK